jgi:hypothetical protein
VTLAHAPASDGRVKLLFKVTDSGIGIAPEAIDRIFTEYTQVDGSISRRFVGGGLGLAICRRLVALMGGGIAVSSQPGQGSTFSFDVTLRPGQTILPTVENVDAPAEPGIRILLAEDNPTNRLVAVRMLEQLGYRVATVCNGLEAMAALEGNHYDLVLMDVMMPELDGPAACRLVRAAAIRHRSPSWASLLVRVRTIRWLTWMRAWTPSLTSRSPPRDRHPGRRNLSAARVERSARRGCGGGDCRHVRRGHAGEPGNDETGSATPHNATIYRCAHSVAGAARNVGADMLATRASVLEQTMGSLNATQIATQIVAMQTALDAALEQLGHARVRST